MGVDLVADLPSDSLREPRSSGRSGEAGPQRLNLRHLQAFLCTARLGSVCRAAAEINISQPAISHAIMGLEGAFGVELFSRTPTGMRVTKCGQILTRRVVRAFAELSTILSARPPGSTARNERDPSQLVRREQLSALLALAKFGSLEQSAAALGVTIKSIKRNIRNLTERVGGPIVLWDGNSARLTDRGEDLCRAGKLFWREIELAHEEITNELGLSRGRLVIGALPLARSYIAPKAMVQIALRNPDVRVRLIEGAYQSLLAGIRTGEIDIMVGALRYPPPSDDIAQHVLFHERLVVVGRKDHPCLQQTVTCISQLFQYPWIAPRAESPARAQFDELLQATARKPAILVEAASHVAVRSLLLESDCLALISRQQIRYEEEAGQLSVVPVPLAIEARPIGFTVLSNWQPTTLQEGFLAELKAICASQ